MLPVLDQAAERFETFILEWSAAYFAKSLTSQTRHN